MPPMGLGHDQSASQSGGSRLVERRYSQTQQTGHNYGSPYLNSYNARRSASYQTTPVFASMTTPAVRDTTSMAPLSAGMPMSAPVSSIPMAYWNDGRRGIHSALLHPSCTVPPGSNDQPVEAQPSPPPLAQ